MTILINFDKYYVHAKIDLSVSAWRSSVWRNLLRESISMGVGSPSVYIYRKILFCSCWSLLYYVHAIFSSTFSCQ